MFALFSRILKLSDHYKSRIQGAFVCAFLESILSKMPIFLAFVVLSGFANKTITGQTCLYVGLGLAAIVLVQMLVHYLSDSLQSAAGYLMTNVTEWGFDLTCVVCGAPVAVEYRPGINQYQTCGKAFVKSRKRKK